LLSLGAVPQCLHTHFLDTGDWCPASGVPLFSVLAEDAAEYFRRGGF